jgi:RNA polymerase sigma-70 factor (ECF subfamily)
LTADATDHKQGEQDGHAGDFVGLVDAHWTAVFRLLFWMSGNTHDAEELTQETFLRALQHFAETSHQTRMRAWLLRVATNAFLDRKRKQNRAKRVALPPDLPGLVTAPGDRIETTEQAELAKAAMTTLSETTRAVFHLRVQESLPYAEIAAMLGTTEQAARWHMHQARSKLLEQLREKRDSPAVTETEGRIALQIKGRIG